MSPTTRRAGLGSKLVRCCEEFAADHGFKELILSTGSIMEPAVGLYRRCGFEENKVVPVEGRFKELLDAAGEHMATHYFRKPITARGGRWMWQTWARARL